MSLIVTIHRTGAEGSKPSFSGHVVLTLAAGAASDDAMECAQDNVGAVDEILMAPSEAEIVTLDGRRWVASSAVIVEAEAAHLHHVGPAWVPAETLAGPLPGWLAADCPLSLEPTDQNPAYDFGAEKFVVFLRSDGARIPAQTLFLPLLEGADLAQATDPMTPIRVTRAGRVVAFVMPGRPEDKRPDDLPQQEPRHG